MIRFQDIKEISSKKPKSGRQRKRKDNGDDSGNDDANFPTRETDALGNPLFKSKQFIEDDDSSSDDEPPKADVNPESKSSQRPQDNSNPRGRRISDMDSSSDDDDSADKTEESGAAVPAAAPSPAARSRSSSPLTSFVATPSQSQRTGRSRRSSFNTSLDQTRNSSRSSSRSSSPVSRRSLDTSRNTSRLQLSSPISRDGGGHSSPDSRRRSPSTSFAYSPSVTSRRSSPVSAVATPISSQTPKRARQASPQSSAKRAKKKLKTSFVDSSSDEDAKEDDTHENSPLKKKADEVENDEAQSPIKTKSKRRAMVLDSDSD